MRGKAINTNTFRIIMKDKKINRAHRIQRLLLYALSIILHPFLKVKKGRVLCIAYGGHQYSCNPRYISEYIVENESDIFNVHWLFEKTRVPKDLDRRVNVVFYRTVRAVIIINTSEFVIANQRTDPWQYGWMKKKGQKYIMTWHSGKALKRIELDAIKSLAPSYIRRMKNDSAYADLFLSESNYTTSLYKKSFLYDGEILEKGLPRNDIFFNIEKHRDIKKEVYKHFGFVENDKIVLYAPTFRGSMELDNYNIDWSKVVPAFEELLRGNVKVLIRLHPNFLGTNRDRSTLFKMDNIFEATTYDNINDLIIASDVMISDYSSCMFDFALMKRPVFIYATDIEKYDRGFYMNIKELPFPFAGSNDRLLFNIENFNMNRYQEKLRVLMEDFFHSYDDGNATEAVVEWMKNHRFVKKR